MNPSSQKWCLGREKRAQLLQRLRRPTTASSAQAILLENDAVLAASQTADFSPKSSPNAEMDKIPLEGVKESRQKRQIGRPSSLQKSSSQQSISSTASCQATTTKHSRLPISAFQREQIKSVSSTSLSIAKEDALFVRKDHSRTHGQLPVR